MGIHKVVKLKPENKIEQLVKDIINNSESQIVFEVPVDCSLLTNEINLRLLKFYAEEAEKEIIINAVDPALITLAQRLGISTIQDLESQNSGSEPDFFNAPYHGKTEVAVVPKLPILDHSDFRVLNYGRLLPAIIVLLFTLSLAVWWFLQPKAVVLVYPKEQILSFKAMAQISTAFNDADISSGKVPAQSLGQQFKITVQTATTGHMVIGTTAAVGKVLIINSSNQPVLLSKGSFLYGRNGSRFLTDRDVLVPKKSARLEAGIVVGESYGKVEVNITAEKKGTSGNQPAKSITGIDQKYNHLLKVTNPAPTKNGADKQVAVVALEDIKNGEAEAKRQMQLAYSDEARSIINRNYLFLADLIKTEIIHIANKPEIGAEGDSLQTEMEYKITVLAPTKVGIQKFLNNQLERNIPANFEAKNRKIDLVSLRVVSLDENLAALELEGQGQVRGLLDQSKIKNLIKGKLIKDAKEVLTRQNEVADVKFKVNNLNPKLPGFGFQIKVVFPAGSKVNYRL